MGKARKKTYKIGITKKLARESFVLSSTRFVSSRIIRFFESGEASPMFTSAKTVDRFVRNNVTGPVFKKIGLRKNYTMPARNAVASFLSRNSIMQKIASLRVGFLNASMRSVGLFLLTFGIYSAAVFLLKNYIDIPVGTLAASDIVISAICALVGLLITVFGDKSILASFGGSKITGSLFSEYFGVNPSSINKIPPKRPKIVAGIGFLIGSSAGVLTLFFSPLKVIFAVIGIVVTILIFNIPEFGLLLTLSIIAFLPVEKVATLILITLISYLVKCIRLKRNLRFGTADAIVLVLLAIQFIACAATGKNIESGEWYFLLFTALYFAVKNLVVSEKLIKQAFNSLCMCGEIAMLLYIIKELHVIIPHETIKRFLHLISENAPNANTLAMLLGLTLPFALASFSSNGTRRRNLTFLVLAVVSAIISDSFVFYLILSVGFFVYVAVAYKAPFGSLIGAIISMPPLFAFALDVTNSTSVMLFAKNAYDSSFNNENIHSIFWQGLQGIGGVFSVILFAVATLFILQRPFALVFSKGTPRRNLICGTIGASALIFVMETFVFNPFCDLRFVLLIWTILGLCGSIYKTYSNNFDTEV